MKSLVCCRTSNYKKNDSATVYDLLPLQTGLVSMFHIYNMLEWLGLVTRLQPLAEYAKS